MSHPLRSPAAQGLYDPWYEHDSCGAGFVVNVKAVRSHSLVRQELEVLGELRVPVEAGARVVEVGLPALVEADELVTAELLQRGVG